MCLQKDRKHRIRDINAVRLAMEGAFQPAIAAASVSHTEGWRTARYAVAGLVLGSVVTALAMFMLTSAPAGVPPLRFVASAPPSPTPGLGGVLRRLAISPDGDAIVYEGRLDGTRGLYRRRLDRLDADLVMPVNSTADVAFSPDGRWVSFATASDRTVKKIPAGGGAAMTLRSTVGGRLPQGTSWTSTNQLIFAELGQGNGLFRMSADGGEPEMLTTPEPPVSHQWPEVLPDRNAVLFVIDDDDSQTIAALDLDTAETRVLIRGGSHPRYASPGHLLYSVGNTLRAVRFDVDRLEIFGESVEVLEGVNPVNLDISDNGVLVYQAGAAFEEQLRALVWIDREGREEREEAEVRPFGPMRLSPDGRQVVYSHLGVDDSDVWIHDLERDAPRRFTFDPARDSWPMWNADGSRVLFTSNRGGPWALYARNADGTGQVEHLLTTNEFIPIASSVAPDGTLVITDRRTGTGVDIGIVLPGDQPVKWLLSSEFNENDPRVSPDGRWLAYSSDASGREEVYVQPFPDVESGRWQVSRDGGGKAMWGGDSSELFYQRSDGKIMLANNETEPTFNHAAPVELFDGPSPLAGSDTGYMFDLAPNGERFLVAREEDSSSVRQQIVVVHGWTAELERLLPH